MKSLFQNYKWLINCKLQYDSLEQHDDATDAFQRCYELESWVPKVRARLDAYAAYLEDSNKDLFHNHLIQKMIETPLQLQYETVDQVKGQNITLNPVYNVGVHEGSEDETDSSLEWETDSEGSDERSL